MNLALTISLSLPTLSCGSVASRAARKAGQCGGQQAAERGWEWAVQGAAGRQRPRQCRARCRQGQRGCLAAAPRQFQASSASLRSCSPRGTDASRRPSETRPLLPPLALCSWPVPRGNTFARARVESLRFIAHLDRNLDLGLTFAYWNSESNWWSSCRSSRGQAEPPAPCLCGRVFVPCLTGVRPALLPVVFAQSP